MVIYHDLIMIFRARRTRHLARVRLESKPRSSFSLQAGLLRAQWKACSLVLSWETGEENSGIFKSNYT